MLLNARGDDAGEGAAKRQVAQAPVNSTLVARATGGGIELEAVGALVPDSGKGDGKQAARLDARAVAKVDLADGDARFVLKGPAQFIVKRYGKVLSSFDLDTIADRAPVISLTEDPKPNVRGSLTLSYKIEDDYGVIGAEANFERPTLNGKALKGRSLVEPPKMALGLPQGAGGLGEGQTTMDLSEHAWAGARVLMTLSAKDEGGNEGKSAPAELTLPQRGFTKPVARVLVEQRRNLIPVSYTHLTLPTNREV